MLDFWVGDWDVKWEEQNGWGKGTNSIKKDLDGYAITENFCVLEGDLKGFHGMSLSVFNRRTQSWTQKWSDNQGGELGLKGFQEGDQIIFHMESTDSLGNRILKRMKFYEITTTSLKWDWESSTDDGRTWELKWRIFYTKKDKDRNKSSSTGLNPKAPVETLQFGQLAGTWNCTALDLNTSNSTWIQSKAQWIFNYTLDGFAIEDLWIEKEKDKTKNTSIFKRDFLGKNVRIFNPELDHWQCVWFKNSDNTMSPVWRAKKINDEIIMDDESGEWRITFFNIKEESFQWKYDAKKNGKWQTFSKIYAIKAK